MCVKTSAYMQALFASTGADALPPPVWGSREHLDTLWENRGDEIISVQGTAGQAIATLDECKKTFSKRPLVRSSRAEKPFCCALDWLHDGFMLLHPGYDFSTTTSGVFEKYVIEVAILSGMQKEVIESYDQKLTVLRYRGALVSAFISIKVHLDSRERVSLL